MAVVNFYTDTNVNTNIPGPAYKTPGQWMIVLAENIVIGSSDSSGSVYRCFKSIPSNFIPLKIELSSDTNLTGTTSTALGLYQTDLGPVISANVFMTAQTLATALTTPIDAMANVALNNRLRKLYEHAGHTEVTKLSSYDIALTGTTMGGSVGGNVRVMIIGVLG